MLLPVRKKLLHRDKSNLFEWTEQRCGGWEARLWGEIQSVFGGPKVRYIWDRKSDIDFENFDQVNIRERLRPLNLSFTVGVSVTISRVFFDFRYDMGLHNISKSVTYDIPADNNAADENTKNEIRFHRRDNVLSFSFGVFF